ncbi:MAG: sel1 repeat family protein [Alphaproteobacteria bacterium]|nr:MAG: sel1 repeat family protein [Alphaproteobacteria bacterium]
MFLIAISITVSGAHADDGARGNNRYLKEGKLDPGYVGQLVVLKGNVADIRIGPRNFPFVKMVLPAPAVDEVWALNLVNSLDGRNIFGLGDDVGVMGYLTDEIDDETGLIVGNHVFVMGICFFNFKTGQQLSFSAEQCAAYQNYNLSFNDSALSELEAHAADGDPEAQNLLGNRYLHGNGVEKDDRKALAFYQMAAGQNLPRAITNLAAMYDTGTGIETDKAKAIELYQKAASLREPGAMINLAILHVQGDGIPEDRAKAYMWISLANHFVAEANDAGVAQIAQTLIAKFEAEFSSDQVAEGRRLAKEWAEGHGH